MKMKEKIPFSGADILLPKTDLQKWATIACDQFTSEPDYWKEVEKTVGSAPSCLKVTLPEVYLGEKDVKNRIETIDNTMKTYLDGGIFTEYKDAMILVERTLADGRTRRGIVGKLDLDAYSYEAGADCEIRPTEGTVLSRIPARVEVRKNALIELPHVMVLIDDKQKTVVEGIDPSKLEKLYDFDLMMGGGHVKGYLIDEKTQKKIVKGLENLKKNCPLLFAVGDGNHSLACAKASSSLIGGELARYALAEIVNIHDDSLDFEPIYRVLFGVDPRDLTEKIKARFKGCTERKVTCVFGDKTEEFFVDGLETKVLQDFLDEYVSEHPEAEMDYIHGENSLKTLAAKENAVGFLFGGISKDELFPYVEKNGPLPRKTFSMGNAQDKRYYVEARKIR